MNGSPTKVLIVGVGSIGQRHLRCFRQTGRANVALCESDDAVREQVAAKYGIERVYADLESALADTHAAAVIATPAHLHIPMANQLAEAGLHMLIEKPLSTTIDGIDALRTTLVRNHLIAGVAYVLRHYPALRAMREAIQSGRFGRPVELIAVCGQHFPTYRPAYRYTYYTSHTSGGGAVQDALTHMINASQWIVGPIDRLVADAAHQVLEGVDVEDTVHVIARHNDLLASYSLNQHQAPNESVITVVCQEATCRLKLHDQQWAWMDRPDTPWQTESFPGLERDDAFIAQANAFLDAIEGRAEPTCTLQEATHTLRTNLAILESSDDGTWKRMDVE